MINDLEEIALAGLTDLADGLAAGYFSAEDLAQAYLTRIEALDSQTNAFCFVDADQVMAAAAQSDARRSADAPLSPYDGIPIAIKDNIDVKAQPTSCGFSFRTKKYADADAEVIARLRVQGLIILGKTNMPPGAIGGAGLNDHFGRTENPWRRGYVAGGSSAGSAAALAAGLAPLALGTDSLGSIRIPASYCGIAGLKPTFGLIPNIGLQPLSISLDTIGPMARYVADLAPIMAMIAGYDPACLASRPGVFSPDRRQTLQGLRIGIARSQKGLEWAPAIDGALGDLAQWLAESGAEVVHVDLSAFDLAKLARRCLIICEVEGALAHEMDLADHSDAFPGPLMDMLAYGSRLPGVQVARARRDVLEAGARFRALLAGMDAMITPATFEPSFPFGQDVPGAQANLSALANAARLPALAMPLGLDPSGLPLGIQILGAEFADGLVLQIGSLIESGRPPVGLAPGY